MLNIVPVLLVTDVFALDNTVPNMLLAVPAGSAPWNVERKYTAIAIANVTPNIIATLLSLMVPPDLLYAMIIK